MGVRSKHRVGTTMIPVPGGTAYAPRIQPCLASWMKRDSHTNGLMTGVRSMDTNSFENKATSVAADSMAAAGALAADAKTRVEDLATQTAATAGQVYGQARDQVRGVATSVARSVERQPTIALLAVGLFCGALGFLLARR
jgi:ElaB/YqjD/DUF883 family membrane-anchored ribosome-binding protein